jgi:hypothetical protein
MKTPAMALLAVATAACDPMWTMELRQSVNPVPSMDCLRRTVSASPRAMITGEYGPRPEPEGFYVMFRGDSVPPYNRWSGQLTRELVPDSTGQLFFSYAWLRGGAPQPREHPVMQQSAEALLAEVAAACAPSAPPSDPECVMTVPFRPSKPCPGAASS